MGWEELCLNKAKAGDELNDRLHRADGAAVVDRLAGGMVILRDVLFCRLHEDVERLVGQDSMYVPVSESRSLRRTKAEIELFQIAESAAALKESRSEADADWYAAWLLRFRGGASSVQPDGMVVAGYLSRSPADRHLAFTDVLAKGFPESRRAPLVLFRLFPLAVQLATSLAWDDRVLADGSRKQQVSEFAAIGDCPQCHGKVLDPVEQCPACGNPLWKSELLMTPG